MATKLEICDVCNKFTDCHIYRKQWLCLNCPKSKIDDLFIEEIKKPLKKGERITGCKVEVLNYFNKNPNIVFTEEELYNAFPSYCNKDVSMSLKQLKKEGHIFCKRIKTSNNIRFSIFSNNQETLIRKAKIQRKQRIEDKAKTNYVNSCDCVILNFLKSNSDKVFRSYELWGKFSGYTRRNIANRLSYLARQGYIYSRKIYIKGRNKFALYSTNKLLVEKPIEEENFKTVYQYVLENYKQLLTTKKLCCMFDISDTAIRKRLDGKNDIVKFNYLNRNFYFPVDNKEEMIKLIKDTVTW